MAAYIVSKGDAFWTFSGGLAGIITASAGNDLYHPIQAMLVAAIGVVIVYRLHFWVERKFKIDDAVGAVAVHGYSGVVGLIIAGFVLWGAPSSPYDGYATVNPLGQLIGAVIMFGLLGFLPGWALAKIQQAAGVLRIPREVELQGLDFSENKHERSGLKLDNATIIEPCYIGANVQLSNCTIGPYVSLGDGTVVSDSLLKNTIVQNNTTLKNADLEDSMIGNNVTYKGGSKQVSIGDYSTIGFNATVDKPHTDMLLLDTGSEDLIKFGMIPEFVGRFPVIIALHELDENMLTRILVEPQDCIADQYKSLFQLDNIELEFSPIYLRSVATKAMKEKTGARGLQGVLEKALSKTQFQLPSLYKKGVTKVIMNEAGIPTLHYVKRKVNDE